MGSLYRARHNVYNMCAFVRVVCVINRTKMLPCDEVMNVVARGHLLLVCKITAYHKFCAVAIALRFVRCEQIGLAKSSTLINY